MSAQLTVLGVAPKPSTCSKLCCYASVGSGFVNDWAGKDPKVAFLLPSPTGDDCVNRLPMSGKGGNSFIRKYVEPFGYTRDHCLFAHVLRCRPKGDGSKKARHGQYPIGSARRGAETACRYYDRQGVLEAFAPDSYVVSQELNTVYQEPAFTRLLQRDIQKAFELAARGMKPIVLMGNAATEMLCPFVVGNGGAKAWRGHWDILPESWPWLSGATELPSVSKSFVAA